MASRQGKGSKLRRVLRKRDDGSFEYVYKYYKASINLPLLGGTRMKRGGLSGDLLLELDYDVKEFIIMEAAEADITMSAYINTLVAYARGVNLKLNFAEVRGLHSIRFFPSKQDLKHVRNAARLLEELNEESLFAIRENQSASNEK